MGSTFDTNILDQREKRCRDRAGFLSQSLRPPDGRPPRRAFRGDAISMPELRDDEITAAPAVGLQPTDLIRGASQ